MKAASKTYRQPSARGLKGRGGLLHGVAFTPKRAEDSLHVEGCLQDVQTALCTSAIRWCANLYTYIGPMDPMLRIVRFGTSLDNLGAKAAQMFQMVSFGTVLDNFRSHGRPEAPNG